MTWKYLELKGKAKLEWAKSELRHEEMLTKGVTINACDCGRSSCRANMCILCWREEIQKLERKKSI